MEFATTMWELATAPLGVFLFGFVVGVAVGDRWEPFEATARFFSKVATSVKNCCTSCVNFFKK